MSSLYPGMPIPHPLPSIPSNEYSIYKMIHTIYKMVQDSQIGQMIDQLEKLILANEIHKCNPNKN